MYIFKFLWCFIPYLCFVFFQYWKLSKLINENNFSPSLYIFEQQRFVASQISLKCADAPGGGGGWHLFLCSDMFHTVRWSAVQWDKYSLFRRCSSDNSRRSRWIHDSCCSSIAASKKFSLIFAAEFIRRRPADQLHSNSRRRWTIRLRVGKVS